MEAILIIVVLIFIGLLFLFLLRATYRGTKKAAQKTASYVVDHKSEIATAGKKSARVVGKLAISPLRGAVHLTTELSNDLKHETHFSYTTLKNTVDEMKRIIRKLEKEGIPDIKLMDVKRQLRFLDQEMQNIHRLVETKQTSQSVIGQGVKSIKTTKHMSELTTKMAALSQHVEMCELQVQSLLSKLGGTE